jgi:putative peptidoglycan lipid II flippase
MTKKIFAEFFARLGAPSRTVGGAAFIIAAAGVVSRFLGFLRDRILASQFGAGDTLDTYYAAFRIPDMIYGLLVAGALSAAFIPIFTECIAKKDKARAWRLADGVLHLMTGVLGICALVGVIFAPEFMTLIAPGFSEEKREAAAALTRIMLLSPVFLSISAVFGGILVSFKRFAAYSFAPIFYNVGIIYGAVCLVPTFGVAGLGWGVVIGSLLHMLIQYPSLEETGFHYRFRLVEAWRDADVRRVIRLMIPRSLGMAANQIGLLVMTMFASLLLSGSLAAFTLANNIQSVPLGLFGIAFSLAAFPSLSLLLAEKKEKAFFAMLIETSRRILFFVVPLSIIMIVFRAQFVRVILGAGHFDWNDTIMTFEILKWLSVSLFAQSLIPLFARAFFALQDTKTPFYIALASEALHIILIPVLLPQYSVEALAMAFSAASIVNCVLLYIYLRKRITTWDDKKFFLPTGKIFLASIVAGLIAQGSKSIFALTSNELDTFIEVFLQLMTGLLIGGGSFILLCYWLKVDELRMIRSFIFCKILRQPETAVIAEDHPERGDW